MHTTIELSTKVIDVEEQLRSTLLHKMRHAAQWLVSLFCGWSRYSTISGKYLLIIAPPRGRGQQLCSLLAHLLHGTFLHS